jgi:hypothetical protein
MSANTADASPTAFEFMEPFPEVRIHKHAISVPSVKLKDNQLVMASGPFEV